MKFDWPEAKKRCRLNQADIEMAKKLGMSPRSLIKNIPDPRQQWKAPVKEWIRDLYEKRFGEVQTQEVSAPARIEPAFRTFPTPSLREIRDWDRLLARVPVEQQLTSQELDTLFDVEDDLDKDVTAGEIEEQNFLLLRRQKVFRLAAQHFAAEASHIPWVSRIAIFGSVAFPLQKEIPRFRRFRKRGIKIWHECKDVDLAVWVTECNNVDALREARSRSILNLQRETDNLGNVAHHQMDIYILEQGDDRFLGALCIYGECPKGKPECLVSDCGAVRFLQQYDNFTFDRDRIHPDRIRVLFDRNPGPTEIVDDPWSEDDEVPF